jgi:hypothetical protein
VFKGGAMRRRRKEKANVLTHYEIQAMSKDLSKHIALLGLHQLSIGMKDRIDDQGLDMLLMYDQDVLHLLVFAVKETLAV